MTFTTHMVLHITVVAVVAPLVALAVAGRSIDPVRKAPRVFAPVQASFVELAVVWAWHTPALHHAGQHSAIWFAAEQAMFLTCGLWLWLSALGGDRDDRDRAGAGVIALLLTSVHMTLLGALIALSTRALFGHPLDDQHLGGAIMLLVGGLAYLAGGLGLVVRLLREGARA
jgi:putative membrane protein